LLKTSLIKELENLKDKTVLPWW